MLKRSLFLTSPLRVSVRLGQLILTPIDGDTETASIPIEDLACLIIENQRVALTLPAINHLICQNVAVVICNSQGMPHVFMSPLDSNTLQGQRFRVQLDASLPFKKSLWQQIVTAKIRNQSELLNRTGKDGRELTPYWKNVKSDDSDNREGTAARYYWKQLFGRHFIRDRYGDPPNNMLNYGYSILRAATARAVVGSGMWPALGIHHRNRSNAFPLADDLMEPFRPFIDSIVVDLYNSGIFDLSTEVKSELIKVLYADTAINGKNHPLTVALELICTSALKVMAGEAKKLNVPTFPGIGS